MLELLRATGKNAYFTPPFPSFLICVLSAFFPRSWYINKKKVIGDYTTEMIIHNATRDLHDATIKCEVHNEVGKSEESQTLDIRCKCLT